MGTRRERRERRTAAEQAANVPTPDRGFSLGGLFAGNSGTVTDAQPNILTVCTGNICRSALAATVLSTRFADIDVRVHSAGTQALIGAGMPSPARALAERNGVSFETAAAHRGRLLDESLLNDADLVLTMTTDHSTAAIEMAPKRMHRTFTVREFARLAATLDDATLCERMQDAANPRARLHALVQAVADQRGAVARVDAAEDDVIDPYRKSAEIYDQSESEIIPALVQVERITRAALQPSSH